MKDLWRCRISEDFCSRSLEARSNHVIYIDRTGGAGFHRFPSGRDEALEGHYSSLSQTEDIFLSLKMVFLESGSRFGSFWYGSQLVQQACLLGQESNHRPTDWRSSTSRDTAACPRLAAKMCFDSMTRLKRAWRKLESWNLTRGWKIECFDIRRKQVYTSSQPIQIVLQYQVATSKVASRLVVLFQLLQLLASSQGRWTPLLRKGSLRVPASARRNIHVAFSMFHLHNDGAFVTVVGKGCSPPSDIVGKQYMCPVELREIWLPIHNMSH